MDRSSIRSTRVWLAVVAAAALTASMALTAVPASAAGGAPWDGTPISHGLGPTYGETWCAPTTGEAADALQGSPLAIIPYAAISCTLQQFQDEAATAGVPHRMDWFVTGRSAGGRDMYGVVVNDLETADQQRDYQRWQQLRAIELTDPAAAQSMLDSWGDDVKMPIYIEADINGNEYEGTDAVMQAIRDLTVTPYGTDETIDTFLDHAILVFVPTQNPDGRVLGIRGNSAVADTNRDYFLQSQPEEQNSRALQVEYLETAGLDMHGYVSPTLIDGLTIPHNPGLEWDIFGHWNQLRTEANKSDFAAAGMQIQRPVNDWCADADVPGPSGFCEEYTIDPAGATESGNTVTITTTETTEIPVGASVTISGVAESGYDGTFRVTSVLSSTAFTYTNPTSDLPASGGGSVGLLPGPAVAQGWDDWGPFYGQTYMANFAVDSSTVEMCRSATTDSSCDGRMGSKTSQYLAFYSSVNFWLDHRHDMMYDQVERFRRGVENAPLDPNAIESDPVLAERGFTDAYNNWMVSYPTAYIVPVGEGQRSDAEANRLVRWLLDNGVQVTRMTSDFTWQGSLYLEDSYVVWMNQALRGLAFEALGAGTDIGSRITDLYASPAAWSHGLVWGADTIEVPRDDATFAPSTTLVTSLDRLHGGIRGSVRAKADWYSVTPRGVIEDRAILDLIRGGITAEIAEAPFKSTTGGWMPAGTLIFGNDQPTRAALDAAGAEAGMWFERNLKVAKPATSEIAEVPRIAILRSSIPSSGADTDGVLKRIFGDDARYVATTSGADSLQNAADDPLASFDVIYNAGAGWPSSSYQVARDRLNAFFARGGGYIATDVSTSAFSFMTSSTPTPLVTGLTRSSQSAFGGIAVWSNVGGASSPISGAYPSRDYLFLPSSTTYFSATPAGAVVDGRYLPTMATVGPANGYVAGMWLNRSTAANDAPVLIHGTTSADSRYVAYATNPTSRYDAEREWPLIVQAALWSNLTDG